MEVELMANQNEQELRENIAKWLHSHTVKVRRERMNWLEETPWEDLTKEYRIDIQKGWRERADEIIAIIKEANYVRLADDQSLPELDITTDASPQPCNKICHEVEQENMLKEGFKRVKL
jgi:hypothetical protein